MIDVPATAVIGGLGAGEWLIHTMIGLSFGLVLFLVASGFTLTFGLAQFVNLSHAATFLVAAHVAYEVDLRGGSFPVMVTAAVVSGTVVSLLVYGLASLRWQTITTDATQQVLFTFGCLLVIADQVRAEWGGVPHSVPLPGGLDGSVAIGSGSFPVYRLVVMAGALMVAAAVWYLQERTRFGALVRAGVDDTEQLEAMGVRPRVLYFAVFGLAGALAGLAGGLGAPILGAGVGQELDLLIFALVAVVVGGLGSLSGAFAASLLVGLVDAYGKALFPTAAGFTIMALVIVVLAVRPSGLVARSLAR